MTEVVERQGERCPEDPMELCGQPIGQYHCPDCGEAKPRTTEFFYRHSQGRDGLRPTCKVCVGKAQQAYRKANGYRRVKEWRAANPEKLRAMRRRQGLRRADWTPDEWDAAFEAQQGVCAIEGCGRPATQSDHDHDTGRRRALLCAGCNVALGVLADDPARIRGLLAYLEAHRGQVP
ncbi:MAG TPA: endonuclease domain-containing protein [Chloroflexota bacterium]|jgi:hypothetical protein